MSGNKFSGQMGSIIRGFVGIICVGAAASRQQRVSALPAMNADSDKEINFN